MKLKKTLFSVVAAATVLMGGMATAGAENASITTTGTVVVSGAGTFDPQFCDALDLGTASVTSATGDTAEGVVSICVIDDVAYRGEVNMSLSATDFKATDATINATIPAKNLVIVKTYNPGQGRWSSGICGPVAGDGSNRPCVGDAAGLANSGTTRVTRDSVVWTVPGSLDGSGQPILHFYNGSGTSETDGQVGTMANMDVELKVPNAQRPANYQSTLTLTVDPATP